MNRKRYEAVVGFFNSNKTAYTLLKVIYKLLPYVMFVAYPALLIYRFTVYGFGAEQFKILLIPLCVLVLVTILRLVINAERPYERYSIPSVFNKQTKGQSMPSRHTASAFIIAMTFLYVSLPLGIAALVMALLIELSRVLAGAHFLRDVGVGAAIGIGAGLLYFLI